MRESGPQTILLIDDNWIELVATQEILERAGHHVSTRDHASGSVAIILRDKPDIVLLDINMPMIAGDALARIVSTSETRPDSLLLLYSSLPLHELQQRTGAAGADGYIQKTESAARLLSQLNHWIARGRPTISSARLKCASDADVMSGKPAERSFRPASHTNRLPGVLFVDDDASMLSVYRRDVLTEEFSGTFAQSGEQALTYITSDSPPDVVVCDMLMPGLTGAELYGRVVASDAGWRKRFIFVTGFGGVRHVAEFIDGVECRVFHKPCAATLLREAIRYSAIGARIFTLASSSGD